MKIKQITSQNRRDFYAIIECEECPHTQEMRGYDDSYFHSEVIPTIKCKGCGKSGKELGVDYRALATKYPDGMQL
jgi:ribosomal protein S27E